jgi:hypothetical protein
MKSQERGNGCLTNSSAWVRLHTLEKQVSSESFFFTAGWESRTDNGAGACTGVPSR